MVDLIQKALYTGLGLAALTKEKAEELVKDLAQQAKLSENEGKELMDSLMKQSDQARQDFQDKVDESALAVVKRLHLVTHDEVEALRAKVEELSARVGPRGGLVTHDEVEALRAKVEELSARVGPGGGGA